MDNVLDSAVQLLDDVWTYRRFTRIPRPTINWDDLLRPHDVDDEDEEDELSSGVGVKYRGRILHLSHSRCGFHIVND